MKVLIVDDSATILKIIKNTLTNCGVAAENIIEASDGAQAYDKYKEHSPELILTDWNMPVMNGLEFVSKVRNDGSKTPIIMITTEGMSKDVAIALKTGVNDYVVKPFTQEALKEKVNNFLS